MENLLTFDDTMATDCTLSNKDWEEELIENIIAEMSEPVITQELEIDDESNSSTAEETYKKSQVMGFLGHVRSFLGVNAPELVKKCLALENDIFFNSAPIKQTNITDFYTVV